MGLGVARGMVYDDRRIGKGKWGWRVGSGGIEGGGGVVRLVVEVAEGCARVCARVHGFWPTRGVGPCAREPRRRARCVGFTQRFFRGVIFFFSILERSTERARKIVRGSVLFFN